MFKPSLEKLLAHNINDFPSFTLMHPLEMNHELWFPLYQAISEQEKYHMILESGRSGRYSIIGIRPTRQLVGKNRELMIHDLTFNGDIHHSHVREGNLLSLMKEYMASKAELQLPELLDISCGLFGYFSYDLVREIECIPEQSQDDLHTPDVNVLEFEQLIVYDQVEQQHWLILSQEIRESTAISSEKRVREAYRTAQERLIQWNMDLQGAIKGIIESMSGKKEQTMGDKEIRADQIEEHLAEDIENEGISPELDPVSTSFSEPEFIQAVEKIQAYISAGDVFQVNLSVRQSRPLHVQPLNVYKHLRAVNPSPYMGYLHFPEQQVICGSPEQLIKLKGKELSTRPIAGTRPRGLNREQDLILAQELIDHPKERAEHVMLVDLERNDLGKVSTFGSVHVNEFMVIEEYSHVMHIVSNVQGELASEYDAFDVIQAVFPGGTITGAPKVRTMEIIEELEPVRRGIYTGAIGWISFSGNMELNITIRTMLVQNEQVHVQAGAGIVIDSVPANEFQESLNKAKALWKAYELSVAEEKVNKARMKKELRMS